METTLDKTQIHAVQNHIKAADILLDHAVNTDTYDKRNVWLAGAIRYLKTALETLETK